VTVCSKEDTQVRRQWKWRKFFLELGADVNGREVEIKQDTPLIAATSLNADAVAILYIDRGANIYHSGCSGGTALHWAAYCGRDKLVQRLIEEDAEINKRCIDYKATPLLWAMHGLKKGPKGNIHNQLKCIKMLVQAGADKTIPNASGEIGTDYLNDEDVELRRALNS
jgi:uncharacterized protein